MLTLTKHKSDQGQIQQIQKLNTILEKEEGMKKIMANDNTEL